MSKKAATTPNRKIPSVKELFELHSRCRVVVADQRPKIIGFDYDGTPRVSRALSRGDVLTALIKKYAK